MTESKASSAVSATVRATDMSRQKSGVVKRSDCFDDMSYENTVKVLYNNLMSNAETIAKAREDTGKKNADNVIPNMNKYIQRSGLTQEDVDKLSVIHVSGTKGKGSTCAFCERILGCHGYKTGLFSSPHLVQVRERIRINGRPISEQMFCKYFWKVYNKLKESQNESHMGTEGDGKMPAFFAFMTILSLHVFLGEGVDVVIMEVGIGGQYDNTNFLRRTNVCGVTSLGMDHMNLLGHTIEEIAWNKAGIFKPGRPAITAPQEQAAMKVILERAVEKQSPLYISKTMSAEQMEEYNIHLGIAGDKQVENASLAVQLFQMWEKVHGKDTPVKVDIPTADTTLSEIPVLEVTRLDQDTVKGLSSCVWPGRTQTLSREKVTYYLDGAHTKESIEACAEWFNKAADDEVKARGGKVARVLVFNITGDRDVAPFLARLRECNFHAAVFCTNILSMVEEENRQDQLDTRSTPSSKLERAESNKASWDNLQRGGQVTQDSPPHTDSQTSLSFPCILQALAWATQGRDPLVEVKDPSFKMPDIPEHLRDSDYVQVLVTGSLLLVGGVLGVLDPHMND